MTALPVVVRVTGPDRERQVRWPAAWPVPAIGDQVTLPDAEAWMHVRNVQWCPQGDGDAHPDPCIILIVGPYHP